MNQIAGDIASFDRCTEVVPTLLPDQNLGDSESATRSGNPNSRYIVGAHVHAREHGVLAEELMKEIFGVHGIPVVVHADRGTSMTSKSVATLLADLGVTRSHSRPKVSNDNPHSEALFKTMKVPAHLPRTVRLAARRPRVHGPVHPRL